MTQEKCIMPENPSYKTYRFPGSERHEIFEGRTGNRKKSIEDGLVVFLTPDQHRMDRNSVHMNPANWLWLKELGEATWCRHYGKTIEDFRGKYGKNYINEEDL